MLPLGAWALQLEDSAGGEPEPNAATPAGAEDNATGNPVGAEDNATTVAAETAKDNNSTDSQEGTEETETTEEGEEKDETLKEEIGGDSSGLGIQRLVEVKDSAITPSVGYNMRYYYSSNPEKVRSPTRKDIMLLENGLSLNLGLGQYQVSNYLVSPSLMVMHMRIWTDPGKKYSDYFRLFDVDSQSATLSFNVELSETLSLNLGYGESRALAFRDDVVSVTTVSPTLGLTKTLVLNDADIPDILMINLGTSLSMNTGDAVNFPALNLIIPEDGSDSWGTNLNLSMMKPFPGNDKITISPSFGVSHTYYTNKDGLPLPSSGRQDWTLNYGLNATYQITETISIQTFGMFSKKTFNGYGKNTLGLGATEYKNFDSGLGISASYNF